MAARSGQARADRHRRYRGGRRHPDRNAGRHLSGPDPFGLPTNKSFANFFTAAVMDLPGVQWVDEIDTRIEKLCVMPCVVFGSKNAVESGKKREFLAHFKQKRLVNQ